MASRSALVTGASGFVASHLVPALVADGWGVRACGRRPRPPDLPEEADYRRVDLVEGPLDELVDGITSVFHLAGASSSKSSEEEMHRDNVVAAERLFESLARSADLERVLVMSTTAVYGEKEQLPSPVPEDVRPSPSRGYGKAKWEAEQVAWRAAGGGMGVVVVRPVSVHGPGAIKLLASAILDVAIEGFMGLDRLAVHRRPVEQRMVHVADLVGACLHLMASPGAAGRAFNVASGEYPTNLEVAGVLADHFGMTVELDDDPDCGPSHAEREQAREAMLAQGMDGSILLSPERFRFMRKENRNNRLSLAALEGTGFRPRHTDLRQAIVGDAEWYRRQRWILAP